VTAPVWVTELAARFWDRAGVVPPFPRDVRAAITRSGVGTVVTVPGLSVSALAGWLARAGFRVPDLGADRPLRGGLYAAGGVGLFFVSDDDPPDEKRFTLAHELAHYLRDYLRPRERVAAAVGPAALDVLDGRRSASTPEAIRAAVRGVPVGPFTHLMARTEAGCDPATAAAEWEADVLACELLAPAAEVMSHAADRDSLASVLSVRFGLPPEAARRYGAVLFPAPAADPLAERIGKLLRPAANFAAGRGTGLAEGRDG
jgi:hypothetical protein